MSLPPSSMTSTSISANGSAATSARASSVSACSAGAADLVGASAPAPSRRRRPATRPRPRRRARARRRAARSTPSSSWSRIDDAPRSEWNWAAPGCLPKPTTSIFVQPLSIGPRNWVCGLIRLTGRMRSAPAAWTSRCSGRPRTSWATTTVSIDERISQSRASARHAELGQRRQLALGGGAAVAAHRRDDERRRAEVAQPGDGAPQQLDACRSGRGCRRRRRPSSRRRRRRRSARTTSSRAAPSTSATAGGSGTGSSTRVSARHGDRRVDRQHDAGVELVPSHDTDGTGFTGARWTPEDRFVGEIAGVGTTSGSRLVIGRWPTSPFGSFADAMVEHADGHRVLDRAEPGGRDLHRRRLRVRRGRGHRRRRRPRTGAAAVPRRPARRRARRSVGATRSAGRCVPCRAPIATSPTWATVVDPVARTVLRGVRTRGTTPGGDEFYGATDRHRIVAAVTHVGRRRPRPAGGRRPAGALRLQLRSAAAVDRGRDDDGAARPR